jgi:hypothetical protein
MLERESFPEIGLVTEKEVSSSDESHSDLDEKILSIVTLLLVTLWNLFVQ